MDEFCAPARGARTAIEAATMSVLMRSRVKKSSQPVTEDCRWEARWSASILPPGCVRRAHGARWSISRGGLMTPIGKLILAAGASAMLAGCMHRGVENVSAGDVAIDTF